MNNTPKIWAILIADGQPAEARDSERLLARARSVAPEGKICAVISQGVEDDWRALIDSLAPLNSFVQPADQLMLKGVGRCLATVKERESDANVILIPADHCAAIELSWVSSVKNALALGSARPDTVYLLHDKPQNDPRSSHKYPGVCSSSVIVGSVQSLLDLCDGARATSIVNILVEETTESRNSAIRTNSFEAVRPLEIVHITSAEEYARLQRGEYGRRAPQFSLTA